MNCKKGISPLFATVLLVGFTVAVAAFLATWTKNYDGDATAAADDPCAKAAVEVVSCSFVAGASGGYKVQMLVKNAGELPLDKFRLVAAYEGDVIYTFSPEEADATIPEGKYKTLTSAGSVNSTDVVSVILETGQCRNVRGVAPACKLA